MYRQSKNLLNIFSTCPHNIANFRPLTAKIGSVISGSPANFDWFRVLPSLLQQCQQRRSPEANQTLHDVWSSPGLVHYIYIFRALAPSRNFGRCNIHFTSKCCVHLYWQRYCTALQQQASTKLRRDTRNGITELSQRAPFTFGWAAITLSISQRSSFMYFASC